MRSLIIAILSVLTTQASSACTRETLKAITDAHLAAQTAGQTSFAANATYTENRKKVDLKSSVLSKALKVDHARAQHDVPQCAAFSELIVTNSAAPYVIATQIRLDNTTNHVSQIDSIITTKGDWLFNVTGTYYWASREIWDAIPAAKRDSRATIQAAGDAYCDLFSNKSVKVPWGTPCARLEGGSYTGKGAATDSCNVGVPSGVSLVNRQYVIDEEYGTVDIIMDFAGTKGQVGKSGLPDSHDFRVEGGKLRFVHTLSSCGGKAYMNLKTRHQNSDVL
ncbi:hypothetical protein HBH56_068390 [Parastagonospora nodorum]|nr:hypothetical protein HBH56_068390 [Parastagonospora nodorum]KAH4165693.1 hypothetical protein HBH44_068620 [Parastagonospora nodorum]KAH5331736.1 hypothetical protein HBI50_058900 [Parastagonospora nodorum]KAH5511558.1 hypothetical protein HBI31_027560 [Parastagonospora nodorum]KAH5657420.1 hypothetical protein HBI51_031700 [Parastagonospora nodorum]